MPDKILHGCYYLSLHTGALRWVSEDDANKLNRNGSVQNNFNKAYQWVGEKPNENMGESKLYFNIKHPNVGKRPFSDAQIAALGHERFVQNGWQLYQEVDVPHRKSKVDAQIIPEDQEKTEEKVPEIEEEIKPLTGNAQQIAKKIQGATFAEVSATIAAEKMRESQRATVIKAGEKRLKELSETK